MEILKRVFVGDNPLWDIKEAIDAGIISVWLRNGLFKKLFELAIDECQKRSFNNLLLLSDGTC